MKNFLLIFLCLSMASVGFAQEEDPLDDIYTLEPRTADCLGAVKLPEKLGPVIGNNKIGAKIEFYKQEQRVPYLFAWEHNVVWYRFEAERSGMLHLLIIPEDPAENFDFVVYHAEGPWFCSTLSEVVDSPVRSNISATPGATGLGDLGSQELVPEQDSNPFSAPVAVTEGETYYIAIDSPDGKNSGHSIEREIK